MTGKTVTSLEVLATSVHNLLPYMQVRKHIDNADKGTAAMALCLANLYL